MTQDLHHLWKTGKHDPGKISAFGEGYYWEWQPGDATRYCLMVIPSSGIAPGGYLGALEPGGSGWLVVYASNGQAWLFPDMPVSAFDVAEHLKLENKITVYQVTRGLGLITGQGTGKDLEDLAKHLAVECRYWRGLAPEHRKYIPAEAPQEARENA